MNHHENMISLKLLTLRVVVRDLTICIDFACIGSNLRYGKKPLHDADTKGGAFRVDPRATRVEHAGLPRLHPGDWQV